MNKYLRAISANMIFFIISTVFFLVITPVAIKVMGEEFYGLWSILIALTLLSNVGALGINAIVMKFSSEAAAGNVEEGWNRVLTAGYLLVGAMAILITVVFVFSRNLIADNIRTSIEFKEQFRQALLWVAAGILPQFLSLVPQGFLIGQLKNRVARSIALFSSVSLWGGAVVLTLFEKNLVHITAWCFLTNLLAFGFYILSIQRHGWQFQWSFHFLTFKKMLNFSGWMFLQSLSIALFSQCDRLIVGVTLGPALAGVYSVGTSIALRLSLVVGQVTEVMLPYASLKDSLGHQQSLYLTFRHLSNYVGLFLALTSSFLILWMQEILSLWISPDYAVRYANPFCVLIIAYSFLSLSRPAHQTLTGIGRVRFAALIYFFSTVLMLLGVFILSQRFGLLGAATADVMMIFLLTYNLYIYYRYGKSFSWLVIFTDLGWGFFLPIIVYALSLLFPQISFVHKSVATLVLISCFAFVMASDQVLKRSVSQLIQTTAKNRS